MIVVLCLAVLAIATFSVLRTCRRLSGRRWPLVWWTLFAASVACGVCFAVWSIFFVKQGWQVSSFLRFVGFPLPVAYSTFEPEQGWTDSVQGPTVTWLIVAADCAADAAIALIPLGLIVRLLGRGGKSLAKQKVGSQ